jgi:hypothetical protein
MSRHRGKPARPRPQGQLLAGPRRWPPGRAAPASPPRVDVDLGSGASVEQPGEGFRRAVEADTAPNPFTAPGGQKVTASYMYGDGFAYGRDACG